MFVHKLCPNTTYLLLTDKLIYTINEDSDTLSIISSQLSECRLEGDSVSFKVIFFFLLMNSLF